MASLTGNAGVIKINGEAVAEVRSYSIELTQDSIEKTVMGDSSRTYLAGLSQFSGTADVYWLEEHFATSASSGDGKNDLDALIQGDVGASHVALTIYPEGESAGNNWDGNIIVTGYTVNASMDGMIEASISFQGSGPLTYTP